MRRWENGGQSHKRQMLEEGEEDERGGVIEKEEK